MPASRGTLRLTEKRAVQMEVVSKKGEPVKLTPPSDQVSQTLRDRLQEFEGQEVEFDLVNGQPRQVREVGGTFVAPTASQPRSGGQRDRRSAPPKKQGQRRGDGGSGSPERKRHFHNPYNFVPAPPRQTSDPDLGDHRPVAQDRFDPARYTGRMTVRMVAKTPLLLPDTEKVDERSDGHKTYPLRLGTDGKPSIPASSVRGMLRSAYEAVTNSRFGTFSDELRSRLAFRMGGQRGRREQYPASPWDLLPSSLQPATSLDELSPADRVFGWVRATGTAEQGPGSPGAVRGLLRVGPVTCTSEAVDAVQTFTGDGLPLAILSSPKPQQGRFYVARSQDGGAQRGSPSKPAAGYARSKGLRGRKVYPHQGSLPPGHWEDPTADRTQEGVGSPAQYQEYRRPKHDGNEQRDGQNRSVRGWVKPGAEFRFDLHVHNLSKVELGALLWLLSLPDGHCLRFGGGKPLGFGSVRLELEACEVRTGDELRSRYSSWASGRPEAGPSKDGLVEAFKGAVARAHGDGDFEKVPFIQAFLTACHGFDDNLPIHYPRATESGEPGPPSPKGESFKWFVQNEREDKPWALQDLAHDKGLPVLKPRPDKGGSGERRRGPQHGEGSRK